MKKAPPHRVAGRRASRENVTCHYVAGHIQHNEGAPANRSMTSRKFDKSDEQRGTTMLERPLSIWIVFRVVAASTVSLGNACFIFARHYLHLSFK